MPRSARWSVLLSLAVFGCLAATAPARAADETPSLPDTRWTVDDIVSAESGDDWALSRDGRWAVWVKSTVATVEGEQKRVGNLHLCDFDRLITDPADSTDPGDSETVCRPLTRGRERISSPLFSPDGRRIAYRSSEVPPKRGGEAADEPKAGQVWVLPLDGGAPWPVTSFDRPVSAFDWIDDDTLAVLAAETPSAWERAREKIGDEAVVVEDPEREVPVRLYRVDLEGSARRLTANRLPMGSLRVSPDGRRAVVSEARSLSFDFDAVTPPALVLVDLATGERRTLLEDTSLQPTAVRWAPGGDGLYFADPRSNHPTYRQAVVMDLYHLPLGSDGDATPERLPLHPWGIGGGYEVARDGVVALEAAGVRYRPVRIRRTADGWRREVLTAEHAGQIDGWLLAPSAGDTVRLVYERSTATLPPQWYAATLDGTEIAEPRQITRLNASWTAKPTGWVEVLRWTGALGDEVEGLLHYPLDWPAAADGSAAGPRQRRPLLLHIHGGPAGVDRDSWGISWGEPLLLWRQRGAFVLQVNYHGSSNYGLDWVTSIEKRYYELEVPDIEAGVDHVIGLGLADPERLAATGWSNGGILSAALIAQTRRYKAASIGAADVEWISDWGNVDFGASFDNYYFGGPPWEIPEVYIDKSPFFDLPEVTTPSIVFTGTADRNVPPHQSWSLYRALQQIGKAPVRLVLFPDEKHGLAKPAHQRRKVEEELAWLEDHVLGEPEKLELPEAVQDGSALAALLGRSRAARAGAVLGVEAGGVVVPETVRLRGLEVGRFEVTRGQWRGFDGSFEVAPGDENLPVTGISLERARAYAAWLRERTGRPFRLPTVAEARALAEAAGRGGNTLDRWLGGAPNPDDLPAVHEAIARAAARLDRAAPLLLPVGSLPGTGDDPVFDLDGNASEWAIAGDGGEGVGEPVGPSAATTKDRRGPAVGPTPPPPAEYVGLRVVVGEPGG
jgi:dipeptidyl aminopeptidase/acylaminoacyl peptidase